jgi:hypothetical protein
MNSVPMFLQKYFSRAALSGYLLAFTVWVFYTNFLRILVGTLRHPSYKRQLLLRAFVCKILDPAPTISFFLWFTLLKLVILMTLFFLLKTRYLKVIHELLTYLLTIEFTVCVLYFILQIVSLVYPFRPSSFFFAAEPFHFFFSIWKMDPWPAFVLIGLVSGFLLNRLGLISKKDMTIKIALTVLSFLIHVLLLRLIFGHL